MVEGKTEQEDRMRWNHTSSIIATLAEINRDRKRRSRPYDPAEFNPYEQASSGTPLTADNLHLLGAALGIEE